MEPFKELKGHLLQLYCAIFEKNYLAPLRNPLKDSQLVTGREKKKDTISSPCIPKSSFFLSFILGEINHQIMYTYTIITKLNY